MVIIKLSAGSIRKMEDIMNEPSDFGLSKAMSQFWQSLQDLSTNAENEGARRVVIERGTAVAETFKYLHDSLTTVRSDLEKEMESTVREINSLAKQIASINKQISEVEPHGYLPNDLYDERDLLVDQLSKLVPIETKPVSYGGNSLAVAEGGRDVAIILDGQKINLVIGNGVKEIDIEITDDFVTGMKQGTETFTIGNMEGKGQLAGLIHAYGYMDGTEEKGLYPTMLDDLDKYAYTYAQVFNEVHKQGYSLNEGDTKDFFAFESLGPDYKGAAGKIVVNSDLLPSDIAASSIEGEKGNGGNALDLGNIKDLMINGGKIDGIDFDLAINSGTLQSFYEGVIGKMAVDGQQANRLEHNTGVLLNSVDKNRRSVSEVSLDEEFSNLIQFQHAYSASARMITAVDEMLDKIINGMGHVGR